MDNKNPTPANPASTTAPDQKPNQPTAAKPPITPSSAQNPVKTLSKLPLIVIGALTVLGIIIGGFFVFNQMNSSPKETGPTPTIYDVPRGT